MSTGLIAGWVLVCVVLPLILHYMRVAPYQQYVDYLKQGKSPFLVLDDRFLRPVCYADVSLRPDGYDKLMFTGTVYFDGSLVAQHRRDPRPQFATDTMAFD